MKIYKRVGKKKIGSCDKCPHFDQGHWEQTFTCNLTGIAPILDKSVLGVLTFLIPEECVLEDWNEEYGKS